MKLFIFACFLGAVFAAEPSLDDCKCWPNQYKPALNGDGKVVCEGILLDHIQECNVPEPPRCVCNEEVTGILTDKTGTWCTSYAQGKELKRWECENKDAWVKYKGEYEEYRKSLSV